MPSYLTLKSPAEDEFVEKRSRFIGYACPVSREEQAIAFINEIRAKHRDATHNVYAYVLREGQTKRYSDAGEPSGTAGVPLLDVLLKEGLTDCALVATRYFGGTLLGAGGLVRAYSHTGSIAVRKAGIVKMSLCSVLETQCDYNFYTRLTALIAAAEGVTESTDFAESVRVKFYLPSEKEAAFADELTEQSLGKLSAKKVQEKYAPIGAK